MDTVRLVGATAVRIDGTYGLDSHGVGEDKGPKAKGSADGSARPAEATGGDLQVVSSQGRLIQAALACEPVNAQAVAEARALLQSGQLDTPQAARRAAQATQDLGL